MYVFLPPRNLQKCETPGVFYSFSHSVQSCNTSPASTDKHFFHFPERSWQRSNVSVQSMMQHVKPARRRVAPTQLCLPSSACSGKQILHHRPQWQGLGQSHLRCEFGQLFVFCFSCSIVTHTNIMFKHNVIKHSLSLSVPYMLHCVSHLARHLLCCFSAQWESPLWQMAVTDCRFYETPI